LHAATAAIRSDLDKRRLIDQAKAFLMKNRKLAEPDAFRFIQKQSMDRRLPMRKIAEAIVLSYGLESSTAAESSVVK
jgi:response regulator NasT